MPEQLNNPEIIKEFPARAYYVSSRSDDTVLLALDVEMKSDGVLQWFDTTKERIMRMVQTWDETNGDLVFQRAAQEGNGLYRFTPLNLKIYEEKVKPRLISAQDFETEDQMFAAFEQTKNDAW